MIAAIDYRTILAPTLPGQRGREKNKLNMRILLIALFITIIIGCDVTYTNSEVKNMVVGDTVFCTAYREPMHALITRNDTTRMIICYKRAWSMSDLEYGREKCQTYSDFRINQNF